MRPRGLKGEPEKIAAAGAVPRGHDTYPRHGALRAGKEVEALSNLGRRYGLARRDTPQRTGQKTGGDPHVVRALQDARAEEADPSGGNDDEPPSPDTVLAEVIDVLNRAPVDVEEVRRRLTDASREGFDWRSIYEEAVVAVRAERPYLSPGIPPVSRVAPH